jgi:hypothetical protein
VAAWGRKYVPLADHVCRHVHVKERNNYAMMVDMQEVELALFENHDDCVKQLVKLLRSRRGEKEHKTSLRG